MSCRSSGQLALFEPAVGVLRQRDSVGTLDGAPGAEVIFSPLCGKPAFGG